jgi:hypothetical protein
MRAELVVLAAGQEAKRFCQKCVVPRRGAARARRGVGLPWSFRVPFFSAPALAGSRTYRVVLAYERLRTTAFG